MRYLFLNVHASSQKNANAISKNPSPLFEPGNSFSMNSNCDQDNASFSLKFFLFSEFPLFCRDSRSEAFKSPPFQAIKAVIIPSIGKLCRIRATLSVKTFRNWLRRGFRYTQKNIIRSGGAKRRQVRQVTPATR